jgi:hypothetical protein
LQTANEERNEPVRRLNQRHGYQLEPGFVTVRGAIPDTEGDLEGGPHTPSHGVS